MTDSELKMVADHMGHSVNIHMDVYALQSPLLERTKIANLLCAMEQGQLAKLKNKTDKTDVHSQGVY